MTSLGCEDLLTFLVLKLSIKHFSKWESYFQVAVLVSRVLCCNFTVPSPSLNFKVCFRQFELHFPQDYFTTDTLSLLLHRQRTTHLRTFKHHIKSQPSDIITVAVPRLAKIDYGMSYD